MITVEEYQEYCYTVEQGGVLRLKVNYPFGIVGIGHFLPEVQSNAMGSFQLDVPLAEVMIDLLTKFVEREENFRNTPINQSRIVKEITE